MSQDLVVDASAALEVLLDDDARGRFASFVGPAPELFAPAILDTEVLHALRRRVRLGQTAAALADVVVGDLERFPIDRRPVQGLVEAVWSLREDLTAYDATYVALGRHLGCPVLTCDERLAAAPLLEAGEVLVLPAR